MTVEVLARSVVAHGGAWVGVAGGDLNVTKVDAGVEHGGDEGVAQHVWVHAGHVEASPFGKALEASGGDVSGHAGAVSAEQDRTGEPVSPGAVEGAADCGWEWGEHNPVAFAVNAENSVAVHFAEAFDVAAGGFEDP